MILTIGDVDETIGDLEFGRQYNAAVPAILLQGSLKNQDKGNVTGGATVLGVSDAFWKLGEGGPARSPRSPDVWNASYYRPGTETRGSYF